MENLETPYDEEDDFIECRVCEKSLRGDTLYKIHLTSPGHLKAFSLKNAPRLKFLSNKKKEDALVAEGKAVRKHIVPKFKDILQYLDYLNLDEPVIGLGFLEEVAAFDPQLGPKYMCRLCNQSAILAEMVCHVIGRKHRQKYVELKRPDLVTWDSLTVKSQGGRSIRAKAEIIERQDGRGSPRLLLKRGTEGKLNISRVPPNQRPKWSQNNPQKTVQDVPPLLPEFKDYNRRKNLPGLQKTAAPYLDQSSMKDRFGRECFDEKLGRVDYREGLEPRQDYYDPFEPELQDRGSLEPHNVPRYDYGAQMAHVQTVDGNYYQAEAPSLKRPYPERDALEEFYSEEVRRGQVRSHGYQPSSEMTFLEGNEQRWSMERDSVTHDGMARARGQGSSKPEEMRRNLTAPPESGESHDHMFDIIRDYNHKNRDPYQERPFDNPGPSRERPSSSQKRAEVSGAMSDIPEPFRRFLTGGTNDEGRKRRSRFSDASPEELKKAKEMFTDDYGPPYAQTGGDPRPGDGTLRPQTYSSQYSDLYTELQSPQFDESHSRGASESGSVFDMLKNVEIENAEEANFLKSKLCSILEEFKSKKLEKAYNNQSRAGVSSNYDDLRQDPSSHQYERPLREDSDHRRPEDPDFNSRRGWNQRENIPEQYNHPSHMESSLSSRGCGDSAPPYYPERLQEPVHIRDYQPANDFFDSRSSGPSLHKEQESRMQRDPRYSNNIDKITCALLELVARK